MAHAQPQVVPRSWRMWADKAEEAGVKHKSIQTLTEFGSGSRVTLEQYLLSRVLWPRPLNPRSTPARHIVNNLGLRQRMAQAEQWLSTYGPYQALLQSIQVGAETSAHGPNDPFNLGIFEMARADALKVVKARDGTGPLQLARYQGEEDTVNACVLELLEGVILKYSNMPSEWMKARISLGRATFKKGRCEAKIDGYLRSKSTGAILAIVEAKAVEREVHDRVVSMQETAEVVAWIKQDIHVRDVKRSTPQ